MRKAQEAPAARKTDPPSSHAAAREIDLSGSRKAQLLAALLLVENNPGCTSLELAQRGKLDRYQLARRLPELERGEFVRRGEIRDCRIGKRPAVTWWP